MPPKRNSGVISKIFIWLNNKWEAWNGIVGVKNSSDTTINPATEDSIAKLIGFEIPAFDYIALTYVAAGNGVGEIETVIYKTGGSGGSTVATLTLVYNASNEITSITKT